MYAALKQLALRVLKAPSEPPEPPRGSHASVRVFRASPRYLTWRLLRYYASALLALVGLSIGFVASLAEEEWAGLVLVCLSAAPVVLGLGLAWFGVRIDYELRYYVVTDRSLRLREGWWTVREKTITYANVQNLRVVQGPIQRLLGIQDLRVETAGGGGAAGGKGKRERGTHEVDVAGVENAPEIRDLVLGYLRRVGAREGGGLGDPDDVRRRASIGPLATPGARAALERLVEEARGLRLAAEARSAGGA
jgi:membrane protein YdbS with pleckstrin-like domain